MKKNIVNHLEIAKKILDRACEENRYRDKEIMQGIDGEKAHSLAVYNWIIKIDKNAPLALQITALFHDVDRIVNPGVGAGFKGDRTSIDYIAHKKAHAKRSADYICPILIKEGFDEQLVKRIEFLILHHDDPGNEVESINDKDLHTLVNSDSLAFFDTIAQKLYKIEGEDRLKDKVRYMIRKMSPYGREVLRKQKIEEPLFEKIKNEILKENVY